MDGIPTEVDRAFGSINDARFAVVDVETTGLYPSQDRVVELAVVVTDAHGNIQAEFESLVNPNRDVGPTSIHGVTAGMVKQAPRFEDIAGDLFEHLAGTIWAGHNINFDIRFLKAECARLGFELPDVPALCTMRLFGHFGPAAESHKLSQVCSACGFAIHDAHSALGDARAAARVLAFLLQEAVDYEVSTLEDLRDYGLSGVGRKLINVYSIPFSPMGRTLSRGDAVDADISSKGSYISDLVNRLRPKTEPGTSTWPLGLYLNLLDRVLEDRRIDQREEEEIWRLAKEWDLTRGDAEKAHRIYLGMLVDTALEDGVITDAEMADLRCASNLLAVPDEELKAFIEEAQSPNHTGKTVETHDDQSLAGLCVCFTGETPGPTGEPISRRDASHLAEEAGLAVQRNVTKKLDLLIVADPDTQSGKARKAREYGIRILAAPVFWQKLGVT